MIRRVPTPIAERSPAQRPRRWPRPLAALPVLLALLGGCAAAPPHGPRAVSYAYPVPVDQTFDLGSGRAVPDDALAARLRGVRLLFVGEHHTEPASHAFQADLIDRLAATGRPLRVALEMFPPSADAALEDWRLGRLDETEFLERSGWYEHWSFPWTYYRALFLRLRAHHIPLYGVNASREVRRAVHADKPGDLPDDVRGLLGDLDDRVPPHAAFLRDVLAEAGHADAIGGDPAIFARFYRVQRMWDRLMGVRTARLAAGMPPDGLAILIVGSGHVAYGLGANLQAARETDLPRLSIWDQVVDADDLDAQGRYPVPIGMADWVRVYRRAEPPVRHPSLIALKLEAPPDGKPGVLVKAVHAGPHSPLAALHGDDVVLALNGAPAASPTALRLAFEALPLDAPARFTVQRGDQRLELSIDPAPTGL